MQLALGLYHTWSQTFLGFAVTTLAIAVSRTPQVVMHIQPESLALLTISYTYRYIEVYTKLERAEHVARAMILFSMFCLTINVYLEQQKACRLMDRIVPTEESLDLEVRVVDEDEKKVSDLLLPQSDPSQATAASTQAFSENQQPGPPLHSPSATSQDDTDYFRFNMLRLLNSIKFAFLPTLYNGPNSPLIRTLRIFLGKPLPPLSSDIFAQLSIFFAILQAKALFEIILRMGMQAKLARSPPPSSMLQTEEYDLHMWKQIMTPPKSLWAFMWLVELSAVCLLAGLAADVRQDGFELYDKNFGSLLGCASEIVSWIGFLLFYQFGVKGKVELEVDQESQS